MKANYHKKSEPKNWVVSQFEIFENKNHGDSQKALRVTLCSL